MARIPDRTVKAIVAVCCVPIAFAACGHSSRKAKATTSTSAAPTTTVSESTTTALAGAATTTTRRAGGPAQTIRLSDSDKGKTVAARSGDTIVVSLIDCFSCGYHWNITAAPDVKVVAHRSTVDQQAQNAPGQVGGSGKRVFTFQAVGAGSTSVTLGYFPPAKGAAAESTFALSFVVSA
jgi:predicted secreted protein